MREGKIRAGVAQVKAYAARMRALSDADLRAETARLKRKLAAGASLASLMPEAYAAVAEADRRMLGFYPFDEQIYGAVALEAGPSSAGVTCGNGSRSRAPFPRWPDRSRRP